MSYHEARIVAFGPPPATCEQCGHGWHGGRPHEDMRWCSTCQDASKQCPTGLRAKPEPTSDAALSFGSVQQAYPEYPTSTETVDLVCALCGRGDSERVLLLFAPLLVWKDGDSFHHNAGICRSCTDKAARIWAEFDSKKTPNDVLP